jgi:HEAT repeat protein
MLHEPSVDTRAPAADVLNRIGRPAASALPALRALATKDPEVRVRTEACDALWRIRRRDQ